MPLPAPGIDGYLPPGRHRATLDEVRARFVEGAPALWQRESLYRLLEVELRLLSDLPGTQAAWLGGDFISHATGATESVLVLGICPDPETLDKALRHPGAEERLTVLDAVFAMPFVGVSRAMRPMGGMVDAYLASPRALTVFDRLFSKVPGDPYIDRGYVEVAL